MTKTKTLAVIWVAIATSAVALGQGTTMRERCEKEVLELHRFFEDWFNGELANDEASFRRFGGVMADDFEIISPEGQSSSRSAITLLLQGAHGFQEKTPMRIWIENLRSRSLSDGLCLVTYEEWQDTGGVVRARLSTAIFSTRDKAPNGVQWHHVHETWLPDE